MNTQRERRRAGPPDERGASLVEFAFIFPVFMTVVLGMFSGGESYNRKISMTSAAAEAARYGATLSPKTFTSPFEHGDHGLDDWLYQVAEAVMKNANGDLDVTVKDRRICVAYVHPAGDAPTQSADEDDRSHGLTLTSDGNVDHPDPQEADKAPCFDDGRPTVERRVQIEVTRPSEIELFLFPPYKLTLKSRSVNRFEAISQ